MPSSIFHFTWVLGKRALQAISLLLVLLSYAMATPLRAEVPKVLRVCGDEDEWPPFTYYNRKNGQKTAIVTGFNVDYLQAMLAETGRRADFTLLPWQRCLMAANRGEYDIVLDGVRSPQRETDFLLPLWHYQLTPVMVYRSDWPLPDLSNPESWSKVKICGQMGYSYRLKGSFLEHIQIHFAAKTVDAAIQMILNNRCDALLHDLEVLAGFPKINRVNVLADKRLTYIKVNLPFGTTKFHLLVSRSTPYKQELLELLNSGITAMNNSGRARKLLKQYLSE